MIEEPPFQIEETGWGGFQVEVKLFFIPEVGSRPQDRTHFLQLEPYGEDADQEKQKKDKMVRSEIMDIIEFNEPTEAFYDIMTDEAQFKTPKSRGKGKGKAAMMKREDGESASVELPVNTTANNPFSQELNAQVVQLLSGAEGKLDKLIAEEDRKLERIRKEKAELIGQGTA